MPNRPTASMAVTLAIDSREHSGQALRLRDVGYRREEHKMVTAGLGVAAHVLDDALRRRQQPGGDALGEGTGEGVVVKQIAPAGLLGGLVAQREVALAPQFRLARTPGVQPSGTRLVCRAGED